MLLWPVLPERQKGRRCAYMNGSDVDFDRSVFDAGVQLETEFLQLWCSGI